MRSWSRVPPAVARWASSTACRKAGLIRSRRPITSSRTPLATQRGVSIRRYSRNNRMSQPTSACGRRQLSAEKA
jgi:hypothetical protein